MVRGADGIMSFTLTKQEAQRLGLLPKEPKPAPKTRRSSAGWTRDNIEQWVGPDGWRVGIARMLCESGMVDMVVAWRDGRAGVQVVAEWNVFRLWTVEQVEKKLKELEVQG